MLTICLLSLLLLAALAYGQFARRAAARWQAMHGASESVRLETARRLEREIRGTAIERIKRIATAHGNAASNPNDHRFCRLVLVVADMDEVGQANLLTELRGR